MFLPQDRRASLSLFPSQVFEKKKTFFLFVITLYICLILLFFFLPFEVDLRTTTHRHGPLNIPTLCFLEGRVSLRYQL